MQVLRVAAQHCSGGSEDGTRCVARVREEMRHIAGRAEAVAATADAALGRTGGGALALPDAWALAYDGALAAARSAAVDELMGNLEAGLRGYSQVGWLSIFHPAQDV